MEEATLNALRKSIERWEANAKSLPDELDIGAKGCALCQLFLKQSESCNGCPVYDATEVRFCEDTPYSELTKLLRDGALEIVSDGSHYTSEEQDLIKEACQKEVDFLKSLLPT